MRCYCAHNVTHAVVKCKQDIEENKAFFVAHEVIT